VIIIKILWKQFKIIFICFIYKIILYGLTIKNNNIGLICNGTTICFVKLFFIVKRCIAVDNLESNGIFFRVTKNDFVAEKDHDKNSIREAKNNDVGTCQHAHIKESIVLDISFVFNCNPPSTNPLIGCVSRDTSYHDPNPSEKVLLFP